MILTPLQKLPKNGEDRGKLNVAKDFKKLPKVENIAQSGHTECYINYELTINKRILIKVYQNTLNTL